MQPEVVGMQVIDRKYSDYKCREVLLWRDSNICRPPTHPGDELASLLQVASGEVSAQGRKALNMAVAVFTSLQFLQTFHHIETLNIASDSCMEY